MRGPETRMRMAEPVRKNSVLRDPVQHAIRADNGGVYRSGQHQDADHHDEARNARRNDTGPTRYIASPPMGLSKKFLRTESGMIITAKNATPAVKIRL